MRTHFIALPLTCLVLAVSHAEDVKPDAAERAIGEAVASLKAQAENTKDAAERRKLSAAVMALESIRQTKTDNHLLADFVDHPDKYQQQTLTFLLSLPGFASDNSFPLNEWNGNETIKFSARVGEHASTVKVSVFCDRALILGAPKIQPGDKAVVTIAYDAKKERWRATDIKRP